MEANALSFLWTQAILHKFPDILHLYVHFTVYVDILHSE
jgi:hypothetical protein